MRNNHSDPAERISHQAVTDNRHSGNAGVRTLGVSAHPLLHPAQGVMAIHGTPPPSFCALHRWHLRYRLLMFLERRARCNQQGHRLVSDWFRSVLQQKERPIAP